MPRSSESKSLGMGPTDLVLKKKNPSGHSHSYLGLKTTSLKESGKPSPEISCFPGTVCRSSDTGL